jgi:hypothetical protein
MMNPLFIEINAVFGGEKILVNPNFIVSLESREGPAPYGSWTLVRTNAIAPLEKGGVPEGVCYFASESREEILEFVRKWTDNNQEHYMERVYETQKIVTKEVYQQESTSDEQKN